MQARMSHTGPEVVMPASEEWSAACTTTLSVSRRRAWILIALAIYYAFAFGVFFRFHHEKWYPLNGDEPHYLVTTSGLVNDHTLVQTLPYEQEFDNDKIYAPYHLGTPGTRPTVLNAEIVDGPHGQYPFHGIGFPLVLSPGFWVGGHLGSEVLGAQVELVLLSGIPVATAVWAGSWRCSSPKVVTMATLSVACASFLLPAAAQIYPDIPGGTLLLVPLAAFACRRKRRFLPVDLGLMAMIGLVPWFNVKFVLPALILGGALVWQYRKYDEGDRVILLVLIVGGSLLLLGYYNEFAYGHLLGPYQNGTAPKVDASAVMVAFGLQIDRFHGIFVMQPLLLAGLWWAVRCAYRRQPWAIVALLLYAYGILINATEPSLYGGGNFASRYGWTSAIVLLLPTVFALIRLYEYRRALFATLIGAASALQIIFLVEYLGHRFNFDNTSVTTWLSQYPSLWGPFRGLFPALYDRAWVLGFAPNVIGCVIFVLLIVIAAVGSGFGGRVRPGDFRAAGLGLIVVYLASVALAGSPAPRQVFFANRLPTQVGQQLGSSLVAAPGREGFMSSGPIGLVVGPGTYSFELVYESGNVDGLVNTWDIRAVGDPDPILRQGIIPDTSGFTQKLDVTFSVPSRDKRVSLQFRTIYGGKGLLELEQLAVVKGAKV